ncbi:SseB family protein [Permianibacter sp. IMCC34836]|uniref:SseB family protein n=1 Tax=Permianibacter fluminis TaxID=2738515 RepID=UPI00155748D8|nr:SseB family protein [Permianibacter fluminis]NQD38121.1 SseB family protein [Permianibacter fluminis]
MTDANPTFTPMNPLEQALVDTQNGRLLPAAFFPLLCDSQVFILIDREIPEGGSWTPDISVLVLNSQSGIPVVAMFTAPERSVAWLQRAPAFKFGLQIDFRWLLNGIADGAGIVLNPGAAVGVELPANLVQKLKTQAQQASTAKGSAPTLN